MFDWQHRNAKVRTPTASFTVRPDDTMFEVDVSGGSITGTLWTLNSGQKIIGDHTLFFRLTASSSNSLSLVDTDGTTIATLTGQNTTAILQMNSSGTWSVAASILGGISSLARGYIVVGGASGATALDANNSGQILVGDGTDLNSVAVSGDATLSSAGALTIAALAVTRAKLSAAAARTSRQITGGTIATTSTTSEYCVVQEAGSLASVEVTPLVALTANDSNYITWTITNLGQAGSGTTVMLAATAPNTTQATGGTGLAINTKRTLTVNGTAGNLVVAAGDLLIITATATGTLANSVTRPIYQLRFSGVS